MNKKKEIVKVKKSLGWHIRHFIGKLFLTLFVLLLIIIGFSQTSSFRNLLKNYILDLAKEELNGELNIENIEGSLFSSIQLNNVSYRINDIDMLKAKKIYLSFSLIPLLNKIISVNNITLENADVNLIRFQDSLWIFDKILKKVKPPDTTESAAFDYTVILRTLRFSDCSFRLKDFTKIDYSLEDKTYNDFNFSDLVIEDLNFDISAVFSLVNKKIIFKLNDFRFNSNCYGFNLKRLNINTNITSSRFDISNFEFITDRSNLRLKVSIRDIDVFKGINLDSIENKNINLELLANNFNFLDLKNLLPDVDMLNGEVGLELRASEKLGSINLNKFGLNLGQSNLVFNGSIKNLLKPENMFLDIKFSESNLYGKDIFNLLSGYKLNFFNNIEELKIEKLNYVGEVDNFKTELSLVSNIGKIEGNANLNFKPDVPKYEIELKTSELNIKSLSKIESKLNSVISVKGEGFSVSNINSTGQINFTNSLFNNYKIDTLNLFFNGSNQNIVITAENRSYGIDFDLNSKFIFNTKEEPDYYLNLDIRNCDIEKILNSKYNHSNINANLSLQGSSFDLDRLFTRGKISIKNSTFKDRNLTPLEIDFAIDSSNNEKRVSINSEILDFSLNGNFNFSKLLAVIPNQINTIHSKIERKIEQFTKEIPFSDTIVEKTEKKTKVKKPKENIIIDNDFNLKYNLKVKDLDIVNKILDNINLNAQIDISGDLSNNKNDFSFSISNQIKYFWIINEKDAFWLDGFSMNGNLLNNTSDSSFSINLVLGCEKFNNSLLVTNSSARLKLSPDSINFRIITEIDSIIKIRTDGLLDISKPVFYVSMNQATIEYQKYKVTNEGILKFSFNRNGINFTDFNLRRKKERINIFGSIGLSGEQDLMISANRISINEIIENFSQDYTSNVEGLVSFNMRLRGEANSPRLEASLMLDSTSINQSELGTFFAEIYYNNEELQAEATYVDSIYTGKDLYFYSSIPINLAFSHKGERLKKDDSIKVIVSFENFNINPIEAFLYDIKNVSGQINGKINVTGSLNNPRIDGSAKVENCNFYLVKNSLDYKLVSDVSFNENEIKVNKFDISNKNISGSTLSTKGSLRLKDLELTEIDLITTGSLLVLSNKGIKGGDVVSGDLVINTKEPVRLTGNSDAVLLSGNLEIKKANLIIPLPESEYQTNQEMFKYIYKQTADNVEIDSSKILLDSLMRLANQNRLKTEQAKISKNLFSNFVSQLKISLSDDVAATFIINKELNQRLYTELRGTLIFLLMEGKAAFQGEIEVTPDSYLSFYQKFNASGSLRFEGEISNPSLNIVAEYSNYYVGSDTTGGDVKEVTIKIKLQGTVQDLGKNLIKNPDNIQVYVNNTLDNSKDASDAVAFIIIGKFKNDLTAQDKSNISGSFGNTVRGAATSILGSLVSSFANAVLGDVIKTVELQQIGEQTKFSLSGRIEKLRFKFGGSTNNIQNLGAADIQLEYPIFEKLFLRLERKNASLRTTGVDIEMINELALKYKYEF